MKNILGIILGVGLALVVMFYFLVLVTAWI